MDLGISGRTALVLGGGGGLGGAIAETIAAEGAAVAVADIDKSAAEERVAAISDRGGRAVAIEWNIVDLRIIDDRIDAIESSLGPVDILINNTGGPPPTPVSHQPTGTWIDHFQSMVLSVIAITDSVIPGMRARGWGRVVTSTSSGVVAPIPNLGLSNTLRSSLVGWSKTLAREVAADGITANVVVPGRIGTARTELLDRAKAEREGIEVDQVRATSTAGIPVGRYGEPSEYAAAVAFLTSVPAAYITGSVVRVDGGLIASV
ncbi:SDR family oxidoreductase [Nocardia otitidiscaviarum]|uniref:SDR family oxidoreductase n=1 Tax=Nocardia otitidiscaviarum TaxID=1823 RepID=UPI0018950CC2|nr:SDR family oxidoreductase [Nocardia otitidiscaviarum]MBF6180039.1 SDR family oxidoreductase [Nocardia otitidiscaviarum]